ncbi:leucyl/phenylalanyl-tRNA--protein transferase [Escherichia coli]|nr:leucyl/phenylalanyl-tRNA--protein transferase [Escherichia coli]CTT31952.1 leucyl/phenylalanyl-tRNA-protein transferase [Escherichia coli]
MASVSISCPSCSATDGVVRNGKSTAGHQRYLCSHCRKTWQLQFTYTASQPGTHQKIIDMAMNGVGCRATDLSPARLLMAYQRGIFPWFSPGDPILWWSPDPRAVLWPESLHISRSMKRFHKRSPYRVTMNYAFGQVIEGCASDREEGTWITRGVVEAYHRLHELGHAHSIEVWREDELVGGMYGVAQGTLFCGESMFSRMENASKTALLVFCEEFIGHGGKLIDCQVLNDHTASLGACEIPRRDYLNYLNQMRLGRLPNNFWVPRCLFSPQE